MSFYFSNALGFFIQFTPCVLMIFLPFPEESLRASRKHVLIGILAGAAIFAALFPLPLLLAPGFDVIGNMEMLAAMALTLAAYFPLVREAPVKKVLVFFIALFYAVSQFWLVNAVLSFLPSDRYWGNGPYPVLTTLLYAICAAVTLPVMLKCVLRPMGDFIREMEPAEMHREFATAILSTTGFIAALMVIYIFGPYPQYRYGTMLMELLLIIEQILIYWLVFRESLRRKRDAERQRALEIQKLQYDKISREMENTRRLRHDLRHHLNVLGALNAQGKREEITEYLKQYGAVADRLDDMKSSGDPVVDGVLGFYLTQAEGLSVPVECDVSLDKNTGVEGTDMTVLLGNCLENALEAQKAVPPEKRHLSVELHSEKAMILLRIRNSCAEQDDSGAPADWKAFAEGEGGRRGVGLGSVSAIAEKYNGSALFERKGGVFTTRIMLNPKQNKNQL